MTTTQNTPTRTRKYRFVVGLATFLAELFTTLTFALPSWILATITAAEISTSSGMQKAWVLLIGLAVMFLLFLSLDRYAGKRVKGYFERLFEKMFSIPETDTLR
ncbi:MAG TPA: hypothetical protein VN420_04725 [Candidatus Fimivivens sp.]|nr:hypothetical protein [Candidatus Fimivivens sp.]